MSSPVGSNNLPGSSCCSASSRCCSGSVSEAEEEEGCLDDWEAVADALAAKEMHIDPNGGSAKKTCLADPELQNKISDTNLPEKESKGVVCRTEANYRAWRSDDVARPQSLPIPLKQNSLNRKSSYGASTWAWRSIVSQPSSCPICCEDLDLTDSCFLPCPCGFRLCLFCHKRIIEADGRCPGCRKQYDHIEGNRGFK